jgi:hypothetical protein
MIQVLDNLSLGAREEKPSSAQGEPNWTETTLSARGLTLDEFSLKKQFKRLKHPWNFKSHQKVTLQQ